MSRVSSRGTARQYLVTATCALSGMYTAVNTVWYTPLETMLIGPNSPVPMTKGNYSTMLSYEHVGEIIGAVIAAIFTNRLGRKKCLLLSVPISWLGWLLAAVTKDLPWLYLSMVLRGFSVGSTGVVAPSYVTEISEARYRGRLGALYGSGWSAGLLYSYGLGALLTYRYYMASALLPSVLFFLLFMRMPESPYFLEMVDRSREAERAMGWLRGRPVPEEMESVRQCVKEDLSSGASPLDLFSRRCRRPLLFAVGLVGVKCLSGISSMEAYATETLRQMELPRPDVGTAMIGVILLLSSSVAASIYDLIGRRPLLLIALSLITAENLFIFSFSLFEGMPHWLLYTTLGLLIMSIKVGLSSMCDVICAEYFPCHVRPFSSTFLTIVVNLFLIASINLFKKLEDDYGPFSNFLFFAGVTFCGLVILIPNMRETANISLREIQMTNDLALEKTVSTSNLKQNSTHL